MYIYIYVYTICMYTCIYIYTHTGNTGIMIYICICLFLSWWACGKCGMVHGSTSWRCLAMDKVLKAVVALIVFTNVKHLHLTPTVFFCYQVEFTSMISTNIKPSLWTTGWTNIMNRAYFLQWESDNKLIDK